MAGIELMGAVLIPCKECNGTGLGTYPNDCYACHGSGVQQCYETHIKNWFDGFKEDIKKRDVEIQALRETVGDLRKLIAVLAIAQMDEFTRKKVAEKIRDLRNRHSYYIASDYTHIGDVDLYDLIIENDEKVNLRFDDTKLTIEEEMAKDVIE